MRIVFFLFHLFFLFFFSFFFSFWGGEEGRGRADVENSIPAAFLIHTPAGGGVSLSTGLSASGQPGVSLASRVGREGVSARAASLLFQSQAGGGE